MFDEYHSVSLSFWTRSGLKEKARQGNLVGSLPWSYVRDSDTKLAVADPERALLLLVMFEHYGTSQESDRTLAARLNAKSARSERGRLFSKGTVREMLCNAAYAGYVSGLRDRAQKPTRTMRQQRGERRGLNPRLSPPRSRFVSRCALADVLLSTCAVLRWTGLAVAAAREARGNRHCVCRQASDERP